LCRITRNHALADDLAQETFIKAFRNWATIQDQKAVKAWLFSIAYRAFLDHYRKEKRRKDLREEPEAPIVQATTGAAMDIEKAMNELPEDCRAAVMLNLAYGFSHDQVSKILNMPLGTVKSHVQRGKKRLRAFLNVYERV